MSDAEFYRQQARRCRDLLRNALQPEVAEQLNRWITEFEQMAAAIEARAIENPRED